MLLGLQNKIFRICLEGFEFVTHSSVDWEFDTNAVTFYLWQKISCLFGGKKLRKFLLCQWYDFEVRHSYLLFHLSSWCSGLSSLSSTNHKHTHTLALAIARTISSLYAHPRYLWPTHAHPNALTFTLKTSFSMRRGDVDLRTEMKIRKYLMNEKEEIWNIIKESITAKDREWVCVCLRVWQCVCVSAVAVRAGWKEIVRGHICH